MSNRRNGTGISRSRYNLIAPMYDPILRLVEGNRFDAWRKQLWSKAEGERILEVGVGTGRDFPYYPEGREITAIDLSRNMLKRAQNKADKEKISVSLRLMDVKHLDFEDNYFHSVVSALVFCAVDNPINGLKEVKRVLRPGGKLVLLEHVISDDRRMAGLMNLMNPLTVLLMGEHINRNTAENVGKSGLTVERVETMGGIFKLIEARKPQVYV